MKFSLSVIAALAGSTFASPLGLDKRAASWSLTAFTRTCNDSAFTCNYSYGISTNDGAPVTSCAYVVTGSESQSARTAAYNNIVCGAFTISSSWSGQFGPEAGFQTLAVVKAGQIVWPAYTDKQLVDGQAVTPDQSYAPVAVPGAKYVVPTSVTTPL